MQLINTIEVSPYDYQNDEYPDDLVSIDDGIRLFDITTISDSALAKILQNRLKDVDLSEFEEQVSALSGGLVLEHDGAMLIIPSCCGDIGALHDWEKMLEAPIDCWRKLWIGHPWIYYRRRDSSIEFSHYFDSELEIIDQIPILVKIESFHIEVELLKVKMQQQVLGERIEKILKSLRIPHASKIAKLMTAGFYPKSPMD